MIRRPNAQALEITLRFGESSGFRVLTMTTGVPKYRMLGVIGRLFTNLNLCVSRFASFQPASKHPHRLASYNAIMLLERAATDANLSGVAALIGEPARAAMLTALMDGLALPAGELAELAGVSPQTASAHLQKLLEGALLEVEIHGRHRYYRLKDATVATALEALMVLAPPAKARVTRDDALSEARTCYDHLAGRLGVQLATGMLDAGWLEAHGMTFQLTPLGSSRLQVFGVDVARVMLEPRAAKACLDWTERRHHLGGALGRAITTRLLELGWVVRLTDSRALRVTRVGRMGLERTFGLRL
jgi:DNA-binding transcriptional ArsR family regulator